MLTAPRSCRWFSAAIACSRIRLAAISWSLSSIRWPRCTVIVIGPSSATVEAVSGRVGVVEEHSTCSVPTMRSRSG